MVSKMKVAAMRRKETRRARAPQAPGKSPDSWEDIFNVDLKGEVREETQRHGIKAFRRFESQGMYKDFVLKSMESKPKLRAGTIGRITRNGARVDRSGIVVKAEKHHALAIKESAKALDKQVHQGKRGRWFVKGRRGSLKTTTALDLKAMLAELMEAG